MKFNKHDNVSPAARAHQAKRKAEFHAVHKHIGTKNALYWNMRVRGWWTKAVLKARGPAVPTSLREAAEFALAQALEQRRAR